MTVSDVLTSEPVQHIAKGSTDVTAVGIGVGSLLGYLPDIAAGVTILWLGLQAYVLIKKEFFGDKKDS